MIKSILDFITGRSRGSNQSNQHFFLLIEEKNTEINCVHWRLDQLEAELANKQVALCRAKENFGILSNYVDRLVSAIDGTEVRVFTDNDSADKVLESAIANAKEQNKQLLYAKVELSRVESVLTELRSIVTQIPKDLSS